MADSPLPDPESSKLFPEEVVTNRSKPKSQFYPMSLWGFLLVPTLALSAGAGLWAVRNLLTLPTLPHCRSTARSEYTSSSQVYCAEQFADGKRVQDFRQAILLISDIPDHDPLHNESQRLIEQWSRSILDLGETNFQAGDLEGAIKMAEMIPRAVHTFRLSEERIAQWRDIWDRSETIYQQAEDEIDQRKWSAVANTAKGLLAVGNQHWATTKYQELMQRLQAAQETQTLQAKKRDAPVRRDNAQSMDSFDAYFTRRDREREQEARSQLAQARQFASVGSVEDLRSAIDQASQILYGTPRYEEAQDAIQTWRAQIEMIEDRPYLDRARALASQGDIASIEAAINEARQIGWGRSLYQEAYTAIEQWREQAYQLRTQNQTDQLGDLDSVTPDSIESYPVQPTSLQSTPPGVGSSEQ